MKLSTQGIPKDTAKFAVKVGNIYRSSRGNLHLIVGIDGKRAHYISYNDKGEVNGAASYQVTALEAKPRVGWAEMPDPQVNWE